MALHSVLMDAISGVQWAPLPYTLGGLVVLLTMVWYWARDEMPYAGIPIVGKEKGEWLNTKAKMRYVMNANKILQQGLKDNKGPFQILASHGPVIILPPSMIEEVRNDDRLSFLKSSQTLFMPQYSGLEAFQSTHDQHRIFLAVIKQSLTQSLGAITSDMAKEMLSVISDLFPNVTKDWTPVCFAPIGPVMAARLSATVFLGEPLCRNKAWIEISVTYTINAMQAVFKMRQWPSFLRYIVQYFLPEFRIIRKQIKTARAIIEPELAERQMERQEALKAGKKLPRPTDALEWMDAQAEGKAFDKVLAQVLMGLVSIHTTSGTLLALMYDLATHPEYIDLLREEFVKVLNEEGGWTKNTLHRFRLLDSCLKESQRLHPMNAIFLNREATQPVSLSDGTHLPKGAMIGIPTYPMHAADSTLYDHPTEFYGRRFLHLRDTDNDMHWQFVTTSPEHYAFGHGKQACPGRFFASNELKIMVAHLLLMFDWKFAPGEEPKAYSVMDSEMVPDVAQKILVRRRVPEVDLNSL